MTPIEQVKMQEMARFSHHKQSHHSSTTNFSGKPPNQDLINSSKFLDVSELDLFKTLLESRRPWRASLTSS